MAEALASLLIKQLEYLLAEANRLSGGLRGEIQFIKDEFERMIAFLRVADSVEANDPELAVWVKQVREVAQDTQDVLDQFALLFRTQRGGFRGRVREKYSFVKNLKARHRLHSEMHSIKSRFQQISEGHLRYQLIYSSTEHVSESSVMDFDGRSDALLRDEAELVGIQKLKTQLITRLLHGDSKLNVISVVGMGGSGKTTLVKKVYDDPMLKSQFQTHAWISFSASFKLKDLMMDLIKQFHEEAKEEVPKQVHSMSTNELQKFIKDFLQKRKFLVVFDDIWDRASWDAMKLALPQALSHSRVMLTTRIEEVASAFTTDFDGYKYQMEALSQEDSWNLFCKKTFRDKCCPPHLKDISESILSKCEGLPLAIVAIGCILALKEKSAHEWKILHRSLGAELQGDGELSRVKKILLLSYYNLPHYLKLCFLYLSIFPEDHYIKCNILIRLWMAEGFLEEKNGLTFEEVGQSYINELLNRSLIQVAETRRDEKLQSCRVHDIVREIIIAKSKEQNLTTIISGQTTETRTNKVRRVAIHSVLENAEEIGRNLEHMRSLLMFLPSGQPSKPLLSKMLCDPSSRLVKVLDLSGAELETVPDAIFELLHLKYLSLRRTRVESIPKSIGKLQNLETLDLKDTNVTELPDEILKLQKLRHLIVYRYTHITAYYNPFECVQSFKGPVKIGSLVSLQKLNYIEADERNGVKVVEELGKLRQLRRLGITNMKREDGKQLCSSLEKLTNLRSLYVRASQKNELIDMNHPLSSLPSLLRSLCLDGRLEKLPEWVPSLHGLTALLLRRTKLREDPLLYLEDLPCLVWLELHEAYQGEVLHFIAGKFPRLRILDLIRLTGLKQVRVENTCMPCLQEWFIGDSKLMQELPTGIQHLTQLQYLKLHNMDANIVTELQNPETRVTRANIYVSNSEDGVGNGRFY